MMRTLREQRYRRPANAAAAAAAWHRPVEQRHVIVSDDAGARQRRHVIDDADVVNSHIMAAALAYC